MPISVTWARVVMWHANKNHWTTSPVSHFLNFDPTKDTCSIRRAAYIRGHIFPNFKPCPLIIRTYKLNGIFVISYYTPSQYRCAQESQVIDLRTHRPRDERKNPALLPMLFSALHGIRRGRKSKQWKVVPWAEDSANQSWNPGLASGRPKPAEYPRDQGRMEHLD